MRILRFTFLPLLAITVLLFTSAPAMAGTFLTEVCVSMSSAVVPGDTLKARLAVTNMGNNHFQLTGVGQGASAGPPPGSSPAIAFSGAAEIRSNGDITMSVNFQGPVDVQPVGLAESESLSIFLPVAGGSGLYSSAISGFDSTVPFGAIQGEDHGTAAIVSCTGFPI